MRTTSKMKRMVLKRKVLVSRLRTRTTMTVIFDCIAIILRYQINVYPLSCKCRYNARWESPSHQKQLKLMRQLWVWILVAPSRSTHTLASTGRSIGTQVDHKTQQDKLHFCKAHDAPQKSSYLRSLLSFIRTVLDKVYQD